jgi:ATP-binding cassette subfamily F protein 2
MVSEASKKKAAQKKAAAAAKRGGKVPSSAASSKIASEKAVDSVANGIGDIQISDRTCTGVLCSHPLCRDIRVSLVSNSLSCN